VTVKPSSRSYSERLWDRVPVWTRVRDEQAAGLLRALLSALGVGLDAVQADVLRLLDDMFVDTCDPRLIPVIGDLVGVQVDRQIPEARQRHQVKYALHLRRRRGTVEAIETVCWQRTGFRATVEEPRRRTSARGPERAAIITGRAASAPVRAVPISQRGASDLQVTLYVARPVARRQALLELVRADSEVHAVQPGRAVAMRRSDGTPILRSDDPADLVGPDRAIELLYDGGDFSVLGELAPRFMNLAGSAPIYVPARTIAIDPELGRAMGPTPPARGLRARRRYRLRFWQALGAEAVHAAPARKDDGVYTFAADGSTTGLVDDDGNALRLAFEGDAGPPVPRPDERLLLVRELGPRAQHPDEPFVLLPPGQPYTPALPVAEHPGALALDTWGLARLFSIEDAWGWDRYATIRLVRGFGVTPPPDGAVEVDVERGRLRIGPRPDAPRLLVRYFRRFDLNAAKRSGEATVDDNTPLGRTARVTFKDTDSPGRP
jgi:P2-related tail formation protein